MTNTTAVSSLTCLSTRRCVAESKQVTPQRKIGIGSQVPILTALEQYCLDLINACIDESEDVILSKARAGDPEGVVQMLSRALPGVVALAYRYKVYLPHDGLEDLVAIGNLAMVECLKKALLKEKPIGFLVGCARIAIIDHVSRFSSLIAKQYYDEPTPVLFLDDDIAEQLQERKRRSLTEEQEAMLYQAVESLTPVQQMVIAAQFRLSGRTYENLFQMHNRTGKRPGHYNKMIPSALKKMRVFICEKGVSYR